LITRQAYAISAAGVLACRGALRRCSSRRGWLRLDMVTALKSVE
jgi:hypothetical protein